MFSRIWTALSIPWMISVVSLPEPESLEPVAACGPAPSLELARMVRGTTAMPAIRHSSTRHEGAMDRFVRPGSLPAVEDAMELGRSWRLNGLPPRSTALPGAGQDC